MASILLCGNVFANYVVNDQASKQGINIKVRSPRFYLNSISNENELTDNQDGTWSTNHINAEYNVTYQIKDEQGNNVGSSYTTTTAGEYIFTYSALTSSTSVDIVNKYVYFNFLPMANGASGGRVWYRFYCHAFNSENNSLINATWPGAEMIPVNQTGLYKLSIPGNLDKVIFNNGDTSENGHFIETSNLDYDITKPMFGCTSNVDITTYAANATPSINVSSTFDYYLHTSQNSWVERSKAYGFEKTRDQTQYLMRCYFSSGNKFGIKDNGSGYWGANNLESSSSDFHKDGNDIYIDSSGYYNIYFKPGEHHIWLTKG